MTADISTKIYGDQGEFLSASALLPFRKNQLPGSGCLCGLPPQKINSVPLQGTKINILAEHAPLRVWGHPKRQVRIPPSRILLLHNFQCKRIQNLAKMPFQSILLLNSVLNRPKHCVRTFMTLLIVTCFTCQRDRTREDRPRLNPQRRGRGPGAPITETRNCWTLCYTRLVGVHA